MARIRSGRSWARSSIGSALIVVAGVVGFGIPVGAVGPCWAKPVAGAVVDPFRAPACVWCPGNRGLEYAVESGTAVRAVAAGTVTFSGEIAGERYLVVELASGWKITYGRIASTALIAGDAVAGGSIVARTSERFLLGLRIDGEYADPAPYLGTEVGRRRLIPTDGRAPRPAPPPRLRCRAVTEEVAVAVSVASRTR
jgi:murein DD-endopeptidase MepM/ murein hydrolase activator NlpD